MAGEFVKPTANVPFTSDNQQLVNPVPDFSAGQWQRTLAGFIDSTAPTVIKAIQAKKDREAVGELEQTFEEADKALVGPLPVSPGVEEELSKAGIDVNKSKIDAELPGITPDERAALADFSKRTLQLDEAEQSGRNIAGVAARKRAIFKQFVANNPHLREEANRIVGIGLPKIETFIQNTEDAIGSTDLVPGLQNTTYGDLGMSKEDVELIQEQNEVIMREFGVPTSGSTAEDFINLQGLYALKNETKVYEMMVKRKEAVAKLSEGAKRVQGLEVYSQEVQNIDVAIAEMQAIPNMNTVAIVSRLQQMKAQAVAKIEASGAESDEVSRRVSALNGLYDARIAHVKGDLKNEVLEAEQKGVKLVAMGIITQNNPQIVAQLEFANMVGAANLPASVSNQLLINNIPFLIDTGSRLAKFSESKAPGGALDYLSNTDGISKEVGQKVYKASIRDLRDLLVRGNFPEGADADHYADILASLVPTTKAQQDTFMRGLESRELMGVLAQPKAINVVKRMLQKYPETQNFMHTYLSDLTSQLNGELKQSNGFVGIKATEEGTLVFEPVLKGQQMGFATGGAVQSSDEVSNRLADRLNGRWGQIVNALPAASAHLAGNQDYKSAATSLQRVMQRAGIPVIDLPEPTGDGDNTPLADIHNSELVKMLEAGVPGVADELERRLGRL